MGAHKPRCHLVVKDHKSGADDYEGDPSIGAEVSVQPHPHRHYHDQIEEEVERLIAGYFF